MDTDVSLRKRGTVGANAAQCGVLVFSPATTRVSDKTSGPGASQPAGAAGTFRFNGKKVLINKQSFGCWSVMGREPRPGATPQGAPSTSTN